VTDTAGLGGIIILFLKHLILGYYKKPLVATSGFFIPIDNQSCLDMQTGNR